MVYCGKPSRGCQMCRTRRIKCDETKPTCQQCQKSRRQCPGYKDDFDLVFRNETQATERRARRTFNKTPRVNTHIPQKAHSPSDSESSSMSSSMDDTPLSASSASSISVPSVLSMPIEHQATSFFLSNFVLLPQPGTNRGSLDYLVPLINSDTPGSPLTIAFDAVALAAMGNRPNAKSLLVPAMEKYNKAIRNVNEALRDPVSQKSDQTLAAVLMLGLFESITSRRTAIAAWGSHIDGAVMIVKMRGKKQLRTKIGHALFIAVRSQMMINCMTSSRAPDLGVDWWLADAVKDEVAHVVTNLMMRTTDLRATVNSCLMHMIRTPENTSKILKLIQEAQELEQAFVAWTTSVPEAWRFRTAAWVDAPSGTGDISKADVYPGKVDSYSDLWIASIWNDSRVARLFLSGIIIRCAAWCCSPVDYRTTPEYASAARVGVDVINDIIASIPFHMGWRPDGQEEHLKAMTTFACGDDSAGGCKGLGAYFCVWPLFSSSSSDFATDGQRAWMKGRLRFIQESIGINQAGVLSYFQLRLPSMLVKRDAISLQAQNATGMQAPRVAVPNGAYPSNPIQSSPTGLPPGINNPPMTPANYAKLQQQYQSGQKTAPYPMMAGMPMQGVMDVELQRAQEEWETKQREEWKKQSAAWDAKKKELVLKARGENAGFEFGRGLVEKYFGLDVVKNGI